MIIWAACDCTLWPLIPLWSVGRCGICGTRARHPMEAPEDGKARELTAEEKWDNNVKEYDE